MKKLLFTIGAALLTLVGSTQFQGTIRGTVTDSSGFPIEGLAVFNFGSGVGSPQVDFIQRFDYTDTAGNFVVNYFSNNPSADTITVGLIDCGGQISFSKAHVSSNQNHSFNNDFSGKCLPNACEIVKWKSTQFNRVYREVVPLVNPQLNINNAIYQWSINGVVRTWQTTNGISQGYSDTLSTPNPSDTVCYKLLTNCAPECFGTTPPPPPALNCNASFYVDTVNSINFQGQVVIWNNSSTDTGVLYTNYAWDFGDGNTSSQQYPTHTYADTGIYNVCLTIYTYRGTGANQDTCVDTFCDSIGFDANGNLIYKKSGPGFTINVIDPATVSLNEADVFSSVQLYPNPNNGSANLKWENNLQVEQVRVFNLSGQELRNIEPAHNGVALSGLPAGVYLVNLQTANASKTLRMIVQ